MNKPDLKTLLKPLIREAVKDVLLESGILSNLITEVVKGLNGSIIMEQKATIKEQKQVKFDLTDEQRKEREEIITERKLKEKKIIEKTGFAGMFNNLQQEQPVIEPIIERKEVFVESKPKEEEVFLTKEEKELLFEEQREKTKREQEEIKANAKIGAPSSGYAMKGIDPNDKGINISGILKVAGGKQEWMKRLK